MSELSEEPSLTFLQEGDTCEYIAQAARAAVLVETATYFGGLRQALLKARRRVIICGWDVDGRMRLVGPAGTADDGAPEPLREFLSHLSERRPKLRIDLVLWDYTALYARDREAFPTLNLGWRTPAGICLTLDDTLPAEASQHQKIVVIDDCLAFCGGIDLAARRWDTSEHRADDVRRRDPAGDVYEPFHDVQVMVDGPAAKRLGQIAEHRLRLAGGSGNFGDGAVQDGHEGFPPEDPWPDDVTLYFRDVTVGMALTRPAFAELDELRQVEALFIRSIASAERLIYIENQYLTAISVADALIERLRENTELEVVVVCPKANQGWAERHTMAAGRVEFMSRIADSGNEDRVAVVMPVVDGNVPVMVHAKVMIVDDRLLRVGSANLNNRSMGLDSECDLAFEATRDDHRSSIRNIRSRLLAEHLGVEPSEVGAALDAGQSALALIRERGNGPRGLRPVDPEALADVDHAELQPLLAVADPDRPITVDGILAYGDGGTGEKRGDDVQAILKRYGSGVAILAGVISLALVWQYTPLSKIADVSAAMAWLGGLANTPWSPLLVLVIYVGLGLLVFPVTILIAATAVLFGPWLGFAYALGGSVTSALTAYGAGALFGKKFMRYNPGPMVARVSKALGRHGVIAIVTMRLLPVAPFTVVNVLAGASHVSIRDFALGTVIGMAPGIAVMTILGSGLGELSRAPGISSVAWVSGALAIAVVWTWAVRHFVGRRVKAPGA